MSSIEKKGWKELVAIPILVGVVMGGVTSALNFLATKHQFQTEFETWQRKEELKRDEVIADIMLKNYQQTVELYEKFKIADMRSILASEINSMERAFDTVAALEPEKAHAAIKLLRDKMEIAGLTSEKYPFGVSLDKDSQLKSELVSQIAAAKILHGPDTYLIADRFTHSLNQSPFPSGERNRFWLFVISQALSEFREENPDIGKIGNLIASNLPDIQKAQSNHLGLYTQYTQLISSRIAEEIQR